jgi:iron(III) transport system permease protein
MARVTSALSWLNFRRARPLAPPLFLSLPALVVVAAVLLPVVYLLIRTVDAGGDAWDVLFRIQTFRVFLRSALLAIAVTGTSVLLAVPLAWLTVRSDLPGRRLWSVLTVLPLVVPSYVGGFALVSALGPRGLLQQALEGPFGVDRLPEIYGFPGAWLALTLFSFPYVLLSTRAAFWGLDPAQEEASRSLGRGPLSTFVRVTLPHLKPAIAAGALLVALYALSDFGAVSLLQFESFTRVIFLQYEGSFDRTLASVLSLVLVAFAVVLLFVEQRARGVGRYHSVGAGAQRRLSTVRLGRWRWPALAFCGLVVLVALGLPASVLLYWLAEGLSRGVGVGVTGSAITGALYASAIAAGVAVVAAVPVTVLAVRYSGRVTQLIEGSVYLGFALPGIVIALALVFFGANFVTPIYQTLFLLVLAYVVLFLPMAVGAARSSLLQTNPSLEEAARSLGRSQLSVLFTITLPLLRPGLLIGGALVFLTAMKELPATLILGPTGFRTLATEMWSASSEGFFAQAAVPGLILVAVSVVPVAMLLMRERHAGA